MSEANRISKLLRRTFGGPAFHGPAVEEALDGVNAPLAAAPSPTGGHNIWQLAVHLAVWQETLSHWMRGDYRRPSEDENWTRIGEASEAAWNDARQRLRQANAALVEQVASLDDARLDQPLGEGLPKVYVALHGIVAHNVYHAGQISLLKQLGRQEKQ